MSLQGKTDAGGKAGADIRGKTGIKKNPGLRLRVFGLKRLAIPYFRMANCHTIIGAKRFHFRVRDGVGWFTLAMVTKQTGVKKLDSERLGEIKDPVFAAIWLSLGFSIPDYFKTLSSGFG